MQEISFSNFDRFERKVFADRLTKVISSFYPFYNEAFVLGLNAKFGSGKTTFLRMWKHDLESSGYKVIYINAWETDFDNEPLVPIVGALLDNISDDGSGAIKKSLQGALGAAALTANNVLDHFTGVNPKEIVEGVENDIQKSDLRALGEGLYKEYSYKKKAYDGLKEQLGAYAQKMETGPLIIMIDELDRVRPDYSVKLLEAIKHIFSAMGVCFILGVDRQQLEISIKQIYGSIDFENYYRRFITREVYLPEAINVPVVPFLKSLSEDYFDEKRSRGVRFAFEDKHQDGILKFIERVACAYCFTPRQIENIFRVFSQFMAVEREQKILTSWAEGAILLIALFVYDQEIYKSVGQGTISPHELEEHVRSLNYGSNDQITKRRYLLYTFFAFSISSQDQNKLNTLADIFIVQGRGHKLGESAQSQRDEIIDHLAKAVNNHYSVPNISGFQTLYELLESWRPIIN